MLSRDNSEIKTTKTLLVFGFANLMTAPLAIFDSNLWLISSIAVNAYLLKYLHTLGKNRRPGSNLISSANNFFSSHVTGNSSETSNAYRNVINGGAAMLDEVLITLSK